MENGSRLGLLLKGEDLPRDIHEALACVNAKVRNVRKTGEFNAGKYGYKYHSAPDIYRVLHPLFQKFGIVVLPQVLDAPAPIMLPGGLMQFTVRVRYVFSHVSGTSVEIIGCGAAQDKLGKALSAAMTVAFKYALIQMFTIAEPGMADEDHDERNVAQVQNHKECQQYGRRQYGGQGLEQGSVWRGRKEYQLYNGERQAEPVGQGRKAEEAIPVYDNLPPAVKAPRLPDMEERRKLSEALKNIMEADFMGDRDSLLLEMKQYLRKDAASTRDFSNDELKDYIAWHSGEVFEDDAPCQSERLSLGCDVGEAKRKLCSGYME